MKRTVRVLGIVLVLVFLLIQFARPERTNPAADASLSIHARAAVPAEVAMMLDRACRDCHSNATRWPWYSQVAPVSWPVVTHVNHGRSHLDLSNLGGKDDEQLARLIANLCEEVSLGRMPLPSYLRMQDEARLSADDVRLLCEWSRAESARLRAAHTGPMNVCGMEFSDR